MSDDAAPTARGAPGPRERVQAGNDSVRLEGDPVGIVITEHGVSAGAGRFPLEEIESVDCESRNHPLPPMMEAAGYLALALAPVMVLWSVAQGTLSVWLAVPLFFVGFALAWMGAESAGYRRRLVLRSAGRAVVILEIKRPWGAAWHLGESGEQRFWEVKEQLDRARRCA